MLESFALQRRGIVCWDECLREAERKYHYSCNKERACGIELHSLVVVGILSINFLCQILLLVFLLLTPLLLVLF